jgi:HK97 family phage prohead protease
VIRRTKALYIDVTETEGARVYTFRASTASVDRQNEIVDQMGWDLASYRENPVVLDSHKYESIEDVIGRCVRVEIVNGSLEADIIFADTERGETAEELVNTGFVKAVSVGFRSIERRPGSQQQPLIHTKAELLEISLVAVPANREAVRLRNIDTEETMGDSDIVSNNGSNADIEVPETVEKAGRVISSKNLSKLQMAMEAISEVIASVGSSEGPRAGEESCGPKKPRKMDIPADVEAALMRFVGGGNNG